jgi:small multidrug resistance pump
MAWLYLILAILAEVAGTTSMKMSEGFTRLVPSLSVAVFYALSIGLLGLSLKKMDVSVAYAVWSGLGVAVIAVIGVMWFEEPVTALKLLSLALIVAGVVGLNLDGGVH